MSDLEFNLSILLKVKSSGPGGLPMYHLLLVSKWLPSISHRLAVAASRKFFSYLSSIGPKFQTKTEAKVNEDEIPSNNTLLWNFFFHKKVRHVHYVLPDTACF